MNGSLLRLCMAVSTVALAVACTTGSVPTEPELASVEVGDGMPDTVPAEEPTPKPAPKSKPKPKAKPAQPVTAPEPANPEPPVAAAPEPPKPLSGEEVVPILGRKVLGPAGGSTGGATDVVVGQGGQTRAAGT